MKSSVQPVLNWKKVLQQDEVIAKIIALGKDIKHQPHQDIYLSLLSSIISQQLSTKVAKVIKDRFLSLFPNQHPKAAILLTKSDEELRSVGLSFQKIGYVRNVAIFAQAGNLNYEIVAALDDEAFIQHVIQIKGVGRWTAEMILMFTLARPDVFPVDDLGIQNAMKKLYGLTQTGKALITEMLRLSEAWRPHRTIASRYLWQALDNG